VADTKTAGSISLLLQAALPCLLYAPQKSSILLRYDFFFCFRLCSIFFFSNFFFFCLWFKQKRGGTNASMAPQIDYALKVLLPLLNRQCGVEVQIDLHKRGFFPRGGGEVLVSAEPLKFLKPVSLVDRGLISKVYNV